MPTLAQRVRDLMENPTVLSFYSKANCKHCRGTGKNTISISLGGVWQNQIKLCDCVYRALNKEVCING